MEPSIKITIKKNIYPVRSPMLAIEIPNLPPVFPIQESYKKTPSNISDKHIIDIFYFIMVMILN